MTTVEDFGSNLFPLLAKLKFKENPDSSEEKPVFSEKNLDSAAENLEYSNSEDILHSVLMLSYAYGLAFKQRFYDLSIMLLRAEENPMIYVRCFAEVLNEKYSPLKFLIVCSFISEIFLFFPYGEVPKRKRYVQSTTKALSDVFHRIFEKDFPQNGWTDIKNEASNMAKGYPYLEPFMDSENAIFTASEIAATILKKTFDDDNECQPADTAMAGAQEEMANVNIPPDPSSQALVNIPAIELPIYSSEGLPTNEKAYLINSENLMYPPAYPISFGTVDEDPQLSHMLQFSGYQTEAVTFENQPSEKEPNFQKVVEAAESFNMESLALEDLTINSSEDIFFKDGINSVDDIFNGASPWPLEPNFQKVVETAEPFNTEPLAQEDLTINSSEDIIFEYGINSVDDIFYDALAWPMQLAESGAREHCAAHNAFAYDDDEIVLSSRYKNKSGLSFQRDEKTEERERNIADSTIISAQESIDAGKHDCLSETLSKENDPERESFSKRDSYGGTSTDSATFSTEDDVNNPESEFISKEKTYDPENAPFSKVDNVNDPESEKFSKEATTASESAVNVLENQSQTGQRRLQATLQDFTTNKAVSSLKNDAQQENEI